jgi:hypothetical protein
MAHSNLPPLPFLPPFKISRGYDDVGEYADVGGYGGNRGETHALQEFHIHAVISQSVRS